MSASSNTTVSNVLADDSAPDASNVCSGKKQVKVATTFGQKVADFSYCMFEYAVEGLSPGNVTELQTHSPEELLEDKTQKCLANIGPQSCPLIVEDTDFAFLKPDGTSTNYPGFDITRVVKNFSINKLASLNGDTRAAYRCSAMLAMPDGTKYYFTVTRNCTICEKRPGPGAIDPYAIPDGSEKAYSELSKEERSAFHPRAELARLILAKLQELGY